ncbi:MAG: RsmE family RNA methyltransferase [Elusimicrobiota bacterium]
MPQFLLSVSDVRDQSFVLRGPEAFHIVRVLRHKEGDVIELFDGEGTRYKGVIRAIDKDGAVAGEIVEKLAAARHSVPVRIKLYLGLLKSSHWEWALEKGTEIGVDTFTPILTPRTVVQLREMGQKKEERWKKIMTSAAKQCRRADIPKLNEPLQYRDAIVQATKSGLTLVGWEKHGGTTYAGLRATLMQARRDHKRLTVNLFIGPEGGFSEEEIELAETDGAALFSLGPNILRAETAAVAAAAIVFYELGVL